MGHSHDYSHGHHHHHQASGKKMFWTVMLNIIITTAEFVGGIMSNSLALISDAFHNLSDVLAIIIAWIANKVSHRESNEQNTFGYQRIEILAALLNALMLIAICTYLIYEAIDRFQNPQEVNSLLMLSIAAIGLVANILSMVLLKGDSHNNMNIKAAYLHMLGDALSSVAVIGVGILIYFFQWHWLDPVVTILISVYIMYHTYSILKDSLAILMQRTPKGFDINNIKIEIEKEHNIDNIHHIHIWNLNDREVHFEAHIDVNEDITISKSDIIRSAIEKQLKDDFKINHVTLQMEHNCCNKKEAIVGVTR